MADELLSSEVVLVAVSKTSGPPGILGGDVVVDLRPRWVVGYLFSFWLENRVALEKEKFILAGEWLVGASQISFQFETVIDILPN